MTDPKKPAWAQAGAVRPHAARIDITDTPANAVLKLVQNDRAAAEACIAMVKTVETADPQAEFGPFTPLVILDSIGLVGPAIGRFYQRVCAGDPVTALGVLHAIRLKLVQPEAIKRALDGKGTLAVTDILDQVRNQMPKFGR